ncbi:MAG: secreted glycosyl hydrolase [Flavobacteriaceae bacterium]|nr:secreted glycosyl hydrolase [Flavobacteriaceae bacterium]|tara:strand:- start:2708 stop:3301 length:594 start_codon:yes stop_codon:yes gene_type:complete
MKKLCLIIICSLTLFGLKAQKNEIFNGKNLRGWKIHGTEKWYVQKGQLVCESGPEGKYGYLSTEKLYNDFILSLEFKQDSDGNSGVFFRSTIKGIKISGWQVEVAPPKKNTGGIYESYGRGWLIKPNPSKDSVLRMGKWNQMKIMVMGSLVTTWLNGIKMVELEDKKIGKGKGSIALQIHNGGGIKVRWKNIRIEEL